MGETAPPQPSPQGRTALRGFMRNMAGQRRGEVARPADSTWPEPGRADRAHAHAGGSRHQEPGGGKRAGGDKQNSSNALKPFSFPMSRLWECCGCSSLKEGSS